jgi:hypothetical protein
MLRRAYDFDGVDYSSTAYRSGWAAGSTHGIALSVTGGVAIAAQMRNAIGAGSAALALSSGGTILVAGTSAVKLGPAVAATGAAVLTNQYLLQAFNQINEPQLVTLKPYPNLKGRSPQAHHSIPKYVGGDPKGPLVELPPDVHQNVTNLWRQLWKYGRGKPTPQELERMVDVVKRFFPWSFPGGGPPPCIP